MIQSLINMQFACDQIQEYQELFPDSILTDNNNLGERLKQTIEVATLYLDALKTDLSYPRGRRRLPPVWNESRR